jgi:hypothetical protein
MSIAAGLPVAIAMQRMGMSLPGMLQVYTWVLRKADNQAGRVLSFVSTLEPEEYCRLPVHFIQTGIDILSQRPIAMYFRPVASTLTEETAVGAHEAAHAPNRDNDRYKEITIRDAFVQWFASGFVDDIMNLKLNRSEQKLMSKIK